MKIKNPKKLPFFAVWENMVIIHEAIFCIKIMKKILFAGLILLAFPSVTMAQQEALCPDLKNNMRQGMKNANTNNEVTVLQNFLKTKGFLSATPNGVFGPATLKAVKSFQSSVGLASTGYVGVLTREKIKKMICPEDFSKSATKNTAPKSEVKEITLLKNGTPQASKQETYCIQNRGKIGKRTECNNIVETCTFKDGIECSVDDYFKGSCKEGVIVEWGEACR